MPLLVGLGVDELSVGAARVGAVRGWVRALDAAEARSVALEALGAADAGAAAALVSERLGGVLDSDEAGDEESLAPASEPGLPAVGP
jgi:signal transduction protein with GAF and PtsI domain